MTTLVKNAFGHFGIAVSPRMLVNSFSLSRVAIGLLFVVCFQRSVFLLYVSIVLCAIAWGTDIVDGYLARRLQVDSILGRHWDSLGDKSFYAAIIVAFNAHGFLEPLVTWGLIVREVALYITRILYVEKLPEIERIRPSTNLHGYFMYLIIVLGLVRMYTEIYGISFPVHLYMQLAAYAALVSGVTSIFHFVKLR